MVRERCGRRGEEVEVEGRRGGGRLVLDVGVRSVGRHGKGWDYEASGLECMLADAFSGTCSKGGRCNRRVGGVRERWAMAFL